MIGGIIATHAGLANGFLEAVEMIAGKQENLLAVSLREGDGLEILIERLQKAAAAMEGEELVIFTDLFGACFVSATISAGLADGKTIGPGILRSDIHCG